MAVAYLSPWVFPGGKPGLYPVVETTKRSLTQAPYPVGTRAFDALGNEYMYVKASGAIEATDAVAGGSTLGLSAVVQSANTATGAPWIGVGHAAFADLQFGWIQVGGVASVKTGNITPGAPVIAKTTAGTLNDAAATDWSSKWAQALSDDAAGVANIFMP